MKRKISICSTKSNNYVFANFLKQFRKALDHYSVGQMLNYKQVLSVIAYMGFVDEQPSAQDIQLAKTITKMLTDLRYCLSVKRMNLFQFLMVLCDIPEIKQSSHTSYFQQQTSGLAMDPQESQQPLIIIELGQFDQFGKWSCSEPEKQQIKTIFSSMRSKRISRNEVESRKKTPKKQQVKSTFKPKICPKSNMIIEQKYKNFSFNRKEKVQNRLLVSREHYKNKIEVQLNQSMEKQLQQCTFKPHINVHTRSQSKQNMQCRSNSQGHIKNLLQKGTAYKFKKQRLKQLQIRLNQSSQLQQCTFKPQTTKHSQSNKWVYVRNRDKQIQRLREGRKQREFLNQVKQRGYPTGVNWSQFINKKAVDTPKTPILCIDLKIMNEQYNINVFDGQNIISIAERISRQHKIPERMWWKVQDLIKKAVQRCADIKVQNNRIFADQ